MKTVTVKEMMTIKKEKIVPIKEVFDKLVKQKEKREFEKEIYPELY